MNRTLSELLGGFKARVEAYRTQGILSCAPLDRAQLFDAVEEVAGLHSKACGNYVDGNGQAWTGEHCTACWEEYPCETIEVITAALGGGPE